MQTAYIGMGANLASHAGPPAASLAAAADRLAPLGRILRRSSLYFTEPIGFAAQPRFFNAIVALETGLAPRDLLMAPALLTWTFFSSATSSSVSRISRFPIRAWPNAPSSSFRSMKSHRQ